MKVEVSSQEQRVVAVTVVVEEPALEGVKPNMKFKEYLEIRLKEATEQAYHEYGQPVARAIEYGKNANASF